MQKKYNLELWFILTVLAGEIWGLIPWLVTGTFNPIGCILPLNIGPPAPESKHIVNNLKFQTLFCSQIKCWLSRLEFTKCSSE